MPGLPTGRPNNHFQKHYQNGRVAYVNDTSTALKSLRGIRLVQTLLQCTRNRRPFLNNRKGDPHARKGRHSKGRLRTNQSECFSPLVVPTNYRFVRRGFDSLTAHVRGMKWKLSVSHRER